MNDALMRIVAVAFTFAVYAVGFGLIHAAG